MRCALCALKKKGYGKGLPGKCTLPKEGYKGSVSFSQFFSAFLVCWNSSRPERRWPGKSLLLWRQSQKGKSMRKCLPGFKTLGSLSLEASLKQRLEEDLMSPGTEGIIVLWKGWDGACPGRSASVNHSITWETLQKLLVNLLLLWGGRWGRAGAFLYMKEQGTGRSPTGHLGACQLTECVCFEMGVTCSCITTDMLSAVKGCCFRVGCSTLVRGDRDHPVWFGKLVVGGWWREPG